MSDTRRLVSKGDTAFANMEKINAELFVMTYGAIVIELIKDLKDIEKVNNKLESMGYNIGTRLIDEFLSKSQIRNCKNFHNTVETIAKVGFKMFLGVEGEVRSFTNNNEIISSLNNTNNNNINTNNNNNNNNSINNIKTPKSSESKEKELDDSLIYILKLSNNPLNDFVELPPQFEKKLIYCNILCGVIRGALEMVQLRVKCTYIQSILKGDDSDEIKIELIEVLEDIFEDD